MNRKIQILLSVAAAAAVIGGAGCTSSKYDQNAYDFDPDRSRTRAILEAQYAKGAADDGALSHYHFEGGRLNGLGRDKLDRMLAAGRGTDLVVYVDVTPDPYGSHNQLMEAVRSYLGASGLQIQAGTVVLGPSSERAYAADALAGMHKLRQDKAVSGGIGSASSDVMASQHAGVAGE